MAFLEGNCGWLPWWLWALDERWEVWGDRELFLQDAKPSELFRRQCFVSVEPEEDLAKYVVAELGDDNLVLSTDWPHDDSRFPHAIDGFLTMAPLPQDSKRKVLWRSEEHTSELQSRLHLVCRLLLEKKNDPQNLPFAGLCRSEDKTPELQSSLTHAFRR